LSGVQTPTLLEEAVPPRTFYQQEENIPTSPHMKGQGKPSITNSNSEASVMGFQVDYARKQASPEILEHINVA
jgi:hypothetical protein